MHSLQTVPGVRCDGASLHGVQEAGKDIGSGSYNMRRIQKLFRVGEEALPSAAAVPDDSAAWAAVQVPPFSKPPPPPPPPPPKGGRLGLHKLLIVRILY